MCESACDKPPIMRGAMALSVLGSFSRMIAIRPSASTVTSSNAVILLIIASSRQRFGGRTRFIGSDEFRRRPAEALQIDSTGAGNVAHGKVERGKPHMVGKMLVPIRTCTRRRNEFLHGGFARLLIGGQRRRDVVCVVFQVPGESDPVLHRQAGGRTDGKK